MKPSRLRQPRFRCRGASEALKNPTAREVKHLASLGPENHSLPTLGVRTLQFRNIPDASHVRRGGGWIGLVGKPFRKAVSDIGRGAAPPVPGPVSGNPPKFLQKVARSSVLSGSSLCPPSRQRLSVFHSH